MTGQFPEYPRYDEPLATWHEPEPPDRPAGGRHPVNVGHLVMGVAFLMLTIVWALFAYDAVAVDDLRWLLPVPWVAAGVVGIVAGVVSSRRSRRRRAPGTDVW